MVKRGLSFVEKYSRLFTGFYKTSEQVKREQQFIDRFDEQEVEICLFKLGYFGQIVLNLTENCNLRCKYCFFSESYDNTRNRTDKIMSEKTAIDALDYYFKEFKKVLMYNPGKKCVVTFYGGEPLLNFEIIKKCVEYTKENCPSEYIFSITSNGLLLQNEIAEYLVSNDFYISVSLDGNKNLLRKVKRKLLFQAGFSFCPVLIIFVHTKKADFHQPIISCIFYFFMLCKLRLHEHSKFSGTYSVLLS